MRLLYDECNSVGTRDACLPGQCQAPLALHESRFGQLPGGCLKHVFQMEFNAGFQAYQRLGLACVGNLPVCASRVGDVNRQVPDSTILNDAATEGYY